MVAMPTQSGPTSGGAGPSVGSIPLALTSPGMSLPGDTTHMHACTRANTHEMFLMFERVLTCQMFSIMFSGVVLL